VQYGTADLQVGPITSTNSQFAVIRPSSGYPVIISPDFCFPSGAVYPEQRGYKETTFSIPSNDLLTPTVTARGFGTGVGPVVAAFFPTNGNFWGGVSGRFPGFEPDDQQRGGLHFDQQHSAPPPASFWYRR